MSQNEWLERVLTRRGMIRKATRDKPKNNEPVIADAPKKDSLPVSSAKRQGTRDVLVNKNLSMVLTPLLLFECRNGRKERARMHTRTRLSRKVRGPMLLQLEDMPEMTN